MNRKSKIIVSITGIILVLLILVGLTYAYFLTRIQGNTNNKSVTVTTANLRLVYTDGNGTITASKIQPGTEVDEKTFSVTNTGNVIVSYGVYIEDVINEFERTEDLELTLTCTSNKANTTCDGTTTTYPENNKKIVSNDIRAGETQTYSLVVDYIEAGVNQSIDMKKKLEGKVQVYGSERINLEFNIANSATGDYGVLESTPKTSYATIDGSTGTYNFVGVEYGAHTLTIYDSNNEVKGTSPITISNGEYTSVNGNNITLPENADGASIPVNNISTGSIELGNIKLYEKGNPYLEGTLAHAIIHNAQFITDEEKALKYAEFRKTPITTPGSQTNKLNYETQGTEASSNTNINIAATWQSWWWTYSTSYTIDKNTGNYSLVDPQKCKYSDDNCIRDLVNSGENVYVYSNYPNSFTNSNDALKYSSGTSNIYRIITAPEVSNSTITIVTKKITHIPISLENILSITKDDYGNSFYYRGDVKNNYIDFAGMCWRIVRIEGDGSIKLILEDHDQTCETSDGDWRIPSTPNGNSITGSFGYDSSTYSGKNIAIFLTPVTNTNVAQVTAFKNFQGSNTTTSKTLMKKVYDTYNESDLDDYLKSGNWCYNNTAYTKSDGTGTLIEDKSTYYANGTIFYYDSNIRLVSKTVKEPTLKCNGTVMSKYGDNITDMYVATLTADEVVFAGGKPDTENLGYYIKSRSGGSYHTLSLSYFDGKNDRDFNVVAGTLNSSGYTISTYNYRPAIRLKPDITIAGGNGTIDHPYEVE